MNNSTAVQYVRPICRRFLIQNLSKIRQTNRPRERLTHFLPLTPIWDKLTPPATIRTSGPIPGTGQSSGVFFTVTLSRDYLLRLLVNRTLRGWKRCTNNFFVFWLHCPIRNTNSETYLLRFQLFHHEEISFSNKKKDFSKKKKKFCFSYP